MTEAVTLEAKPKSDGWAPIKKEYLIVEQPRQQQQQQQEEGSSKSSELGIKRPRGQNQERGGNRKILSEEVRLCVAVARGRECTRNAGECRHSHDLDAYLASRLPDIPDRICPAMEMGLSECRFGYTCRMSGTHKKVVLNASQLECPLSVHRSDLPKNFPLSDQFVKRVSDFDLATVSLRTAWPDLDAKVLPSLEHWRGKTYLAPLTTVGNLPFRRICREWGVDITCGEMAMADKLLEGRAGEWALLKRHAASETSDFGVQIAGASTAQMTRVAEMIKEQQAKGLVSVDFVDVNMGCPIDLLFDRGMGSGLLGRPRRVAEIVSGMAGILSTAAIPLTVKVRIGIDDGKPLAQSLLPLVARCGARAFTIHGRTRQQRYTREADWDFIERECVQQHVSGIQVNGNGDVMGWEEIANWRSSSDAGRGAIMVGRGALIKPWIFTEAQEQRHWDISAGERMEMLKRYCRHGLEHWGSDGEGVEKTRRFLLEWMSFLHRYIPVGLLERLPQRLNERPHRFHGRNDLETLMASESVEDWMELARRALGCREPEGYSFIPKHKSNSYAPSVLTTANVVQEYQG